MSLNQSQSFLGGYNEIYEEKDPLAGILTTAYGVKSSYLTCLHVLTVTGFGKTCHLPTKINI